MIPQPNFMIRVFLDESGISNAPYCVVAGYRGSERQWKRLEELWSRDGSSVEFHAKRFFGRTDGGERVSPYREWGDKKAEDYLACKLEAIERANIFPLGTIVDARSFRSFTVDERRRLTGAILKGQKWVFSGAQSKPYYLALMQAIVQAVEAVKRHDWVAHFCLDEQEQLGPLASKLYAQMKTKLDPPFVAKMGDMTFSSSGERPGLQAADLLAHAWYRYRVAGRSLRPEVDRVMQSLTRKGDTLSYLSADVMNKLVGKAPLTPGGTFTS